MLKEFRRHWRAFASLQKEVGGGGGPDVERSLATSAISFDYGQSKQARADSLFWLPHLGYRNAPRTLDRMGWAGV